jgi:hypothetical protein
VVALEHAQAGETACGLSGEAGHGGGDPPAQVVSLEHAQADEAATGQAGEADH